MYHYQEGKQANGLKGRLSDGRIRVTWNFHVLESKSNEHDLRRSMSLASGCVRFP